MYLRSLSLVRDLKFGVVTFGLLGLVATHAYSAELIASDGTAPDFFGLSAGLSGNIGLVGAVRVDIGANANQGSAYLYRNLDIASGTVIENAKLIASDGEAGDGLGGFVTLFGHSALIGAGAGGNAGQGSAYLYRNLDTASGTVAENAKLIASDGAANDGFGRSTSLTGTLGLVGASGDDIGANSNQGSAYVYRNLDTASGTVTENAKLIASDGAAGDVFGVATSLFGTTGVIGSYHDSIGANSMQGSAYVYRNLNTASGTVTENAKLVASDGAADDYFGLSVSLSGAKALVGSYRDNIGAISDRGSAYLYRNLDTVTGTVTESAKLTYSEDPGYPFYASGASFGYSVSLDGNTALVGALYDDSIYGNQGAAYIFRNLDAASGTVIENIKLTASDGAENDYFGGSVALDGDQFIIGAELQDSGRGKAYSGSVSSMTTLDTGNVSRVIDGISFKSQDDWIIGQSTDNNTVTLNEGDAANIIAFGKGVFIGMNVGSENNNLIISGTLMATDVHIGSTAGNTGNTLQFESTAAFVINSIYLAPGNFLRIQGDYSNIADLLAYLDTPLQVWSEGLWMIVDDTNYTGLIADSFSSGYTTLGVVPEPKSWTLLIFGSVAVFFYLRFRRVGRIPDNNS